MEWQPIETAPTDGTGIDVWCVPPDDCDFEPINGGIRLTNVAWHTADDDDPREGWFRVLDDGDWDFVEEHMDNMLGLPAWEEK